jgi:hypothetical protein
MLAVLPCAQAQHSNSPSIIERQVEAAYLYKFGGYVDWPPQVFPDQASPLTIGVLDADVLADELARITAGRSINGRPVTVRKLQRDDPLVNLHVLFVGQSSNAHLAKILAAVKGQSVLTVTESPGALALGSMINFVIVDGRVRFEIAPRVADLDNLRISARLLAAAYKVAQEAT